MLVEAYLETVVCATVYASSLVLNGAPLVARQWCGTGARLYARSGRRTWRWRLGSERQARVIGCEAKHGVAVTFLASWRTEPTMHARQPRRISLVV